MHIRKNGWETQEEGSIREAQSHPPMIDMNENTIIHLDVAIVGGGFTGVYCARALIKELGRRSAVKVGLISEENYMVFQPMLPEVASASISPRHVVNPLRLLCKGAHICRGHIEEIRRSERELTLNAGPFSGNITVRYQHLVLALGAVVDLSRIPGMPEHAYLMRNVGDAMQLRTTIIGRVEEANLETRPDIKRRLLTFVVVGGGYSGVETAGHILDLFRSIHKYYPSISAENLQVYLIHSGDHLLPTLSRRLGEYSARKLQARGLKLVMNQRVRAVTANRVHLPDGSVIETNTVISTVGNAPHPLVIRLCEAEGLKTEKGRICTDPTCRVPGQPDLWAGGDCAAVPYVKGGFSPATAQFAMRQGILIGRNIARALRHEPLRKFDFKGYGEMASIGHRLAVADILGYTFSGFLAWWMWRTVYLAKLPRLDRKLRVVLDWTLDLFFPRDINHLSPRHSTQLKEIYLEKGDFLFHQGEPAFSLYILKSGAIDIRDENLLVHKITPGEFFGERALLEDRIWHYDAVAAEPATLVSMPAPVFRQMVRGSSSLHRFFQQSAGRYQARAVIDAMAHQMPERLAAEPIARWMERDLRVLRPDMGFEQVLRLAKDYPHSSYPVVDEAGRLMGVVKREDFYEAIRRGETTLQTLVSQMPLSELPTVPPNQSVREVMELFARSGSNKVLVVDQDRRLQGIATILDIVTAEATRETPLREATEPAG